jgi:hypothetical protein
MDLVKNSVPQLRTLVAVLTGAKALPAVIYKLHGSVALQQHTLAAYRASVSADFDARKFMVSAVARDPSLSLVDALVAQPEWAGTLGDDDVRALREYEAELHALDVEWRADRVYHAAARRRTAAERRRTQG